MNWTVEMRNGQAQELAVVDIVIGNTFFQLIDHKSHALVYPLSNNLTIEQEALDEVQSYIDEGNIPPEYLTVINFNQTSINQGIQNLTMTITDLKIETPPSVSNPDLTNGLIVLLGTSGINTSALDSSPTKGEVSNEIGGINE